ncbi:hypothetical protein LSH36_256g05008 [Paralvinella palmiformis]|uniref:H15 domain-containing protein n=1 Tax=Paralvinella palmiformis TaxID=53620 RepID=A0AAD9N2K8_9ANNE|nr:hypothetical protein LSH36_256g05008 [Paralvinella palmiformis]
MADTVAPTKPKKVSKPKKPANHPKYSEMIKAAVANLKERGGSSRQAILKYIVKHYDVGKDEKVINAHLKLALRAGVKNGSLKQSKGVGASGSFRIGKDEKAKKPKAKKATKLKAKKPKAKKATKPKKAATGDKKAKKPKAKKPKTPKKAGEKKVAKPKKAAKPKASKPKPKKPAKTAKKPAKKAAKK